MDPTLPVKKSTRTNCFVGIKMRKNVSLEFPKGNKRFKKENWAFNLLANRVHVSVKMAMGTRNLSTRRVLPDKKTGME